MKKFSLLFALLAIGSTIYAQPPLTGSFTDCNNQTKSIQATLGTGYSIIIAHKGVDCSICVSQAPSFETWASQNSNKVEVWCALTYKYDPNNFSNPCQATNSWVSTHNWSNIFTFPDNNRQFINIGTPQYYVYSARDSTLKYSGSSRSTAYSVALQESVVGIQDQELKNSVDWRIQNRQLMVNNRLGSAINLKVVDTKGSLIKELRLNTGNNTIDLSSFNQAIYLLQFYSDKGVYAEKIYIR